jgi:translation initiation factor 2 alpha subunit (eIF-2alpha)
MNKLEVGDKVLCTVDRIIGTAVFVKIDGNNQEGEIVMSEVAPGRIRNIRDYVVPKKKIVCKVLRISDSGNIELSLRRVTQKEKKEVIEQNSQEKSYSSLLKSILGEGLDKAIKEISAEQDLVSFLEESKANPAKLEKVIGKENAKKVIDILNTQKKKKTIVKKEIHLTTIKPNGITIIKKVLEIFKGVEVKYISAGRYSLSVESEDIKTADKKLKEMVDSAEKESKRLGIEFAIK